MTESTPPAITTTGGHPSGRATAAARTVLPLWIAALSLAVIAVVMIIASVELLHAVRTTQASVVQLQQQVQQLKSGLGGLLGG